MKKLEYKVLQQKAFLSRQLVISLGRAAQWIRENSPELLICDVLVKKDNMNRGWAVIIYYKYIKNFSNLDFDLMEEG